MLLNAVFLCCLAGAISVLGDSLDKASTTSLAVSSRGHHDYFNEYGFPELVFGSHAAAIAAFTYYIVIFLKTYLLIHLGLVRQREAEHQWSSRTYEADRYDSLDNLFE